jgi:hypothetical protein
VLALRLVEGGDHIIGRADASEAREDLFECEAVLLGVLSSAGVFDHDKGEAEAGALAGG